MGFETMKQRILAVPSVAAWPRMVEIVGRAAHQEFRSLWDYPFIACRAVGGRNEAADAAAAAVFCALASVHLVDDMLDDDPAGDYHLLGSGVTANLALAFQAAGHQVLDDPGLDGEMRSALQALFARMSLATAFGQDLDTRDIRTEEEYWETVEAKTPPLFGGAFHLGARLGGAGAEVADRLERLGGLIGLFIQVSDDLGDALKIPAGADWQKRCNNLAILYALTADHPEREAFERVSANAGDPAALAEAQKILLRSGAVSYCALKLIELSRQARELLAETPLHDPEPIERLLGVQMHPLDRLFRSIGVETPALLLLD
jgi:geranylgeranyl pyrophosphate synthase